VAILDGQKCIENIIYSQDHNKFGGILPEYAARNHVNTLPEIMKNLDFDLKSVDAIAVTFAPGLLGSLMVGTSYAKALSYNLGKPLVAVHHIEGHILAAQYEYGLEFPYGALVVSGGHTLLAIAHGLGKYQLLGVSLDDAAGECFDKVARELGLPQPGGPAIEKLALNGSPNIKLPVTLHKDGSCNFSFSGLKTAAIRAKGAPEDIAASFQFTVAEILAERIKNAILLHPEVVNWALVGGVASNRYILNHLTKNASLLGKCIYCPSPRLCTDNALMVAYAGKLYAERGVFIDLELEPRASISLTAYSRQLQEVARL
jgi:N6-L-threonylcarbamoyladenine synthase